MTGLDWVLLWPFEPTWVRNSKAVSLNPLFGKGQGAARLPAAGPAATAIFRPALVHGTFRGVGRGEFQARGHATCSAPAIPSESLRYGAGTPLVGCVGTAGCLILQWEDRVVSCSGVRFRVGVSGEAEVRPSRSPPTMAAAPRAWPVWSFSSVNIAAMPVPSSGWR